MALGWLLGAFGILPSRGASIFSEAKTFIENNYADCHDSATKEAGLDLAALQFEPEDKGNFVTWVKVHDRVKAGRALPATFGLVKMEHCLTVFLPCAPDPLVLGRGPRLRSVSDYSLESILLPSSCGIEGEKIADVPSTAGASAASKLG